MKSSVSHSAPFRFITLIGVSGCGKTTIGKLLADQLGWEFIESDDHHSKSDVQKMSAGIPLDDDDRWPWLKRLNRLLLEKQKQKTSVVLACSALKQSYRDLLYENISNGVFVFLKGDFHLIQNRMEQRKHFMKPSMLQSQFDALEEPIDAILIDINNTEEMIVEKIIKDLEIPKK